MAKKSRPKRPTSRRPVKRKTKPGVTLKLKRNPKFERRVAELGVNLIALNDTVLSLCLELQRKHPLPAAALLYDAAVVALYAAANESDNPKEWLKAARRAARLA